ncbi:MAG TPA: hypothetical protein VKT72_09825 [Candidatus Baltobacteraceae bacterium]|nr:hypothetical protein [Candidatus Baltobacteraceae bacterium]
MIRQGIEDLLGDAIERYDAAPDTEKARTLAALLQNTKQSDG